MHTLHATITGITNVVVTVKMPNFKCETFSFVDFFPMPFAVRFFFGFNISGLNVDIALCHQRFLLLHLQWKYVWNRYFISLTKFHWDALKTKLYIQIVWPTSFTDHLASVFIQHQSTAIVKFFSSPRKLLGQIKLKVYGIVLDWFNFRKIFDNPSSIQDGHHYS